MALTEIKKRLENQINTETHVSEWLTITQERVTAFAEITGDVQWIHTDPGRAARESPYGATIAHGYLIIALYPLLRGHVGAEPPFPGVRNIINYGVNKVRFTNAVVVGARIRARTKPMSVEQKEDALQIVDHVTFEIEGEAKPACVADVVRVFHFSD